MDKNVVFKEPESGKMDNFYGDRSIVITNKQLAKIKTNLLAKDLHILNIGFYPHAKNHYRKREGGANGNILIYCIDGKGVIQVKDEIHTINPNMFCVLPKGISHVYWASENSPWSIYYVEFGGKKSNYFAKHFGRAIKIEQNTFNRIDDRIRMFNELLTTLELGYTDENMDYANLFLNSLLATFFYIETFRSAKGYRGTDPIEQAIFFMQNNLNKNIKIREIAELVNLSESHLTKLFRNKTGSSPLDYFINLKMQEAIRLLLNQSLRVKEVAYKLGYSDAFYFSRIFTKHIGENPTSFLKHNKKS